MGANKPRVHNHRFDSIEQSSVGMPHPMIVCGQRVARRGVRADFVAEVSGCLAINRSCTFGLALREFPQNLRKGKRPSLCQAEAGRG